MVGTQWEGHNSGDTIVGAQCAGGTMWAQCRGTINLWEHNQFVGVQSICICGGTACRAPTNCCHLLPFHAILCHPMPSHAQPCPTMLLPPCHHAAIPPPCYHAMTPPHALPLPFHATAAICCHPCPPMLYPQISAPNSGNPHDGVSTVVEAQSRA